MVFFSFPQTVVMKEGKLPAEDSMLRICLQLCQLGLPLQFTSYDLQPAAALVSASVSAAPAGSASESAFISNKMVRSLTFQGVNEIILRQVLPRIAFTILTSVPAKLEENSAQTTSSSSSSNAGQAASIVQFANKTQFRQKATEMVKQILPECLPKENINSRFDNLPSWESFLIQITVSWLTLNSIPSKTRN